MTLKNTRQNEPIEKIVKDPVCGMQVENKDFCVEYNGRKLFFCSQGCRDKFEENPEKFSEGYIYDLIIIGGGPAGLTAAVYASVLKIHTFLITEDIGGQAIDSSKIKNYMGFDFITGPELVQKFRNQFLHSHYLDHRMDEVLEINKANDNFEIVTRNKNRFLTKAIIIASGMKRRKLGVPGEDRLLRKGISHSAVQDTSLFSGSQVVVVGGGNSGIQTAKNLLQTDCKVTLVEKANIAADPSELESLKQNPDFQILDHHDLIEIQGQDKVEAAVVQSLDDLQKKKISCSGVFIQVGLIPNTEFCRNLLELNENGEIRIKPDCSTNIEGIFACGDVTDVFGKRIIIASGEGAKAALNTKQYLARKKETKKQ